MAQQQTPLPQDSGTLAKLSRPWLPEAFLRERLFLRLDELADRPCTWIGAPAGYGKTVLAASYVEARRAHCLWYQVDEDDADPATFFYYLGLAADQRDAGPPLPLLTPEYQDNLPAFTRRYVQAFGQRLPRPFVLLFDNYHCLSEGAILHGVLAEMLAHLPAGIRCLITSRGEPPAELTRARVHGQLVTIEAEELRLTLPETAGLVELGTEHRLSADQVEELHAQVQGWAAGLTLLLRQSSPARALLQPTATQLMFDYFAAEVFARADPTTQRFLLKTALLPTMTTAMADRMTDSEVADGLLSALVRRHYFTFRDQSPEPRYRYHDLFRAFLLERGSKAFGTQECDLYQRRAAAILEADGEIGAAVDLWRALGDWEQVGRLVMQEAGTLLRQGRGRLVEAWLTGCPSAIRDRSPWLLFWLGQCRLPQDAVAARATFARAYRLFKQAGDMRGLWLAWSAVTDTYILAWDNFRAAGGWLVEFERLRVCYQSFPSADVESRVTFGVLNLMILARPGHPEFAAWEGRVARLLESNCPPDLYLVSLNNLLFHYIWNVGQRGKAAWALTSLRAALAQAPQVEPVLLCALLCWEFCYQYWYEGDPERCLVLAEAAYSTAVEEGISLFNSLAFSGPVYVHLSTGRLGDGRAALKRFGPVLSTFRPLERAHYTWLSGWEAWLSGRLPGAEEMLRQSLQFAQRCSYQSEGFCHLGLAQVEASKGDCAAALRHLAAMRPWIRATGSQVGAFLRALAAAQLALARGRNARAQGLLRLAFALGRAQGYVFFPLFRSEDVVRLCTLALQVGIELEYVQDLIRKRGLLPDLSAPVPHRWPYPVKVYALGDFALVVDDQPVTFRRKAQRKPLELLKILIAWGGRNIEQARIADVLWPDADGDAAQRSLATTLHRLRRLLSHEQAVYLRDGRLSLDERYCRVDAWSLERQMEQVLTGVRESSETATPVHLASLTNAILCAYRGPFLGQDPESWTLQARNRLRDRYLKCLDEVGAYWEARGDWTMARTCYERSLDVEATWEGGYRGLMRCHAGMGQPGEVERVFHRCMQALASRSLIPSPATERLYRRLSPDLQPGAAKA